MTPSANGAAPAGVRPGAGRGAALGHGDLELLADLVAERVAARAPADPRPLVNTETAAAFVDVAPSWLASQARNGLAPCRRLGKYVRFDLVELRAWIDATAASGPVTGCGPVPDGAASQHSSASAVVGGPVVPSVVPSRARGRAA
ncbi:MAG: hypothetical protein JWM93_2650 [Frankiales bacterium]|nr:hypothetical protein [Frankiales bacterium]